MGRSPTQFERKKTDFQIELFEYEEQKIFEIDWRAITHPHWHTASLKPKVTIKNDICDLKTRYEIVFFV